MTLYRDRLPQLDGKSFLTDGGMETTLLFHEQTPLPCFAAFPLLQTAEGTEMLRRYYQSYAELAVAQDMGFMLESAGWRASADWGQKLGYDAAALATVNRRSITLLEEIRSTTATASSPMVISGAIGPRGDGYRTDARMTVGEAQRYHEVQVQTLSETAADLVTAYTINYVEEAIGIAQAARRTHMPVAISFTLETDGRLPSRQSLTDAIRQIDSATDGYPHYFLINCAHPTHFASVLEDFFPVQERLRGLRANASKRSHAELDDSPDLDIGDPEELGDNYRELCQLLPHLRIFGGCCGTDLRHVSAIARAVEAR